MARQLILLVVATALFAACGTSDGSSGISAAPDRTVVTAATTVPTAEPTTTVTRPEDTGSQPRELSEIPVDELGAELHLLLPRGPEASAIFEMMPISLWWYPTNIPEAVFLDDWWELPAIGCGVYASRGEDPDRMEAVLQLAVYPTSEAARAGASVAAGLPRFADAAAGPAELPPPRGFEDVAGFAQFVEDPASVPSAFVTKRWFTIGRIDRVLAIGGLTVHGDEAMGGRLTDLMEAVADRAGRFGELSRSPEPVPAAFPQPMAAILFAGPDPTFDLLGIGEVEIGPWSVQRGTDAERREVFYEGELFTSLTLEVFWYLPNEIVDGLRTQRLGEAMAEFAAGVWQGEDVDLDVAYSDRGLARTLVRAPHEARMNVWALHEASLVSIELGDPEFETLDPSLVVAFTPVLDALVGIGPGTGMDPTPGDATPNVDQVPPGKFCRDLEALGFDYSQAMTYWVSEGRPDRMDADRNGVPCETVYTSAEVMAYWGEQLPAAATNEFAFVRTVEPGPPGSIVADFAQWFADDDADRAATEDGVIEPGASLDNPWYVRNVNPRLRTFRLSTEVVVILGDWHPYAWEPGYECVEATPATLAAAGLRDHPTWGCVTDPAELATLVAEQHAVDPTWHVKVWLVVEGNTVTAIQEQYTP